MTIQIKDYGNEHDKARAELEAKYGQVWTTKEAMEAFHFLSFMAPFAHVVRIEDNVEGWLEYQHNPRFYFGFTEKTR